ncbi:hypothetical protein TDB9533_00925 [Thalassocella blandensis]|nr:hypothetical protein TDB9533_00925 [Thalassocella blandensis]
MNTYPVNYDPVKTYSRFRFLRGLRYGWVALLSIFLIIAAVVFYLSRPPVYSSVMSVVLPASSSSSNFSIQEVGSANHATNNPFGSVIVSPLVNYKEIFKSREVIKGAATFLHASVEDLRSPRVEIRERTSIMYIHADGPSPDAAQDYAWALYDNFQESLSKLREDEIQRKDSSIREALFQYRERLDGTRAAIVDFQQRSLLVDQGQVNELMKKITEVESRLMTAQSSASNTEKFVYQLSSDLGVSPALAGKAFTLQSDPEFRGYIKELDESAKKVAEFSSQWGQNHPKVVAQTLRYEGAKKSLLTRSVNVVGAQAGDILHSLDLTGSPHRADLFASLMNNFAKLQGIEAEINELDKLEDKMRDQLKVYMRESAELERLEREHALAEAVFTSAAARLESGKSDVFASYPAVQLLSIPSLPSTPKSPNRIIAIGIGVMGVFFVLFGLFTAWHRNYLISLLLKNS